MRVGKIENFGAAKSAAAAQAAAIEDPVRRLFVALPRPIRFLGVGGLGLITDLAVFTAIIGHGVPPLAARLVSLAVATLVTWRLNRALTFDRSGRRPADEAMRYAAVAAVGAGGELRGFCRARRDRIARHAPACSAVRRGHRRGRFLFGTGACSPSGQTTPAKSA